MLISGRGAAPQEGTKKSDTYLEVSDEFGFQGCVLDQDAPARRLIEAIGDKWSLLCLYALDAGPMRFNAMERTLAGVSQKVLSQTLRKLERSGLVTRTVYPEVPPKVVYELSPLGSTLRPLLGAFCTWSQRNAHALRLRQT